MKSVFYYFQIMCISLLFSCTKKDDINGPSTEQIRLNIQATVDDFSDNLLKGKMASNYTYEPTYETSMDYDANFILVAEVLPFTEAGKAIGPKLLTSATKFAEAKDIDRGDIYRLMVYDNSGKLVGIRDYIRGSESNTEPLLLYRNTKYTFIAYSLNGTSLADLDQLLYVNNVQAPSLSDIESTSTLSNTLIWGRGNDDLLFYREVLTTKNDATDYLAIKLKHQYNLLQTTIDVSDTGYSIEALAANLETQSNSVQINFENGGFKRYNRNGTAAFTQFQYSTIAGIVKSKAVSDPVIINAKSKERLLEITTLKIGTISRLGKIVPYNITGVELKPGYRYNLNVKLIPKDSTDFIYGGQEVARIDGQVWMRYNLGASSSSRSGADVIGTGIQGDYYQWGRKFPFLSGIATTVNGYTDNADSFSHYGATNQTFFTNWNSGSNTSPKKGSLDPCPTDFRLPTNYEYESLIKNTTAKKVTGSNSSSAFNNAMQLTSKRKSSVILTFPAQGYVGEADNGTIFLPHSVSARGQFAYTKSSSYNNKGTEVRKGVTYIKLEYMLLEGISSAGIYTGPGGGKVSAMAVGHPIRCIAEQSSRVLLNDRTVDNSNGGNVSF